MLVAPPPSWLKGGRGGDLLPLCRKQELQRRKEYQLEMKEMQQRVKGRPLLLEQVAQVNT